jgi:DNA-binding cell septation regulator SpoVG
MQSMIQSLHHYQLIFQLEILLHLMLLSMSLLVFLMIELEFCCGDTISKRLWQKKSKFIENKSLDKRSMAATKMYGTSRMDAYSIIGVRGFASIVFGDSFKITNIAILENAEKGSLFVSMPRYKSNERDEDNAVVYKDV